MTVAKEILEAADSVLLVDWPSADVPDTLVAAGYSVLVKGGPEPGNYSARELRHGEVTVRKLGHAPDRVDLVYCHRPLTELPAITALAKEIGARAVWRQSGLGSAQSKDPTGCWVPDDESRAARDLVESAGLCYVDDVYIADVARELRPAEPA